ncbi:MAG: glutathione-disulfide reductase [Rhodomicrobium sp.]|nr:MAG: glutathione-disulfide reductase [Rhodomicrobium sp.]
MSFDFDLFVIGAGSGGVRAARMAASHGAKVAIAEEYRFGGTCVIRGCVPKKLFVYAARFDGAFQDAAGFGWDVGDVSFNWQKLVAAKDKEISRLSDIYLKNLTNSGVTSFSERAEITGPNEIKLVSSGQTITAKTILIAVGGAPYKPEIEGAELGITSNEAFDLETLPASITVIGGGYIAVEFASIFNGLGVDTALAYRGPEVLRGFDMDVRTGLTEALGTRGIDVRLSVSPTKIERQGDGYLLHLDDGSVLETGLVMFATGRVPHTSGLGLDTVGVTMGQNGKVIVDEYSKTSADGIYAVGDVTDRVNLTPIAIREGAAFVETVFNNNPTAVDHSLIPTAVFSEPEIGTLGLSEDEALSKYGEIDVYKSQFNPMKNAVSDRVEKTLMKLIVETKGQRVVGCHILGPDAGEIIQALGIAVVMGATKADFDKTVALHPSAAEELVTMRDKSYSRTA